MSRAALLAAILLAPSAPPASIDFGSVQLGGAARHLLRVAALDANASGAGFSATRTRGGVLIVFEPYELHEKANRHAHAENEFRTGAGQTARARHRHHPTPRNSRNAIRSVCRSYAHRPFRCDRQRLVSTCTLMVNGHVIGRLRWPASTFCWRIPTGLRGPIRITVDALDRAGNHATATTSAVQIRR
jgi:hypothetical protein